MFEAPFWIGVYERFDEGYYEVCKITFGSEPKDYEVYDFLLKNWNSLKFSPPIKSEITEERKINPKRMQREINNQLQNKGMGTKAQQALKLQHEQNKMERKVKSKEQRKLKKNASMLCVKKNEKLNIEVTNYKQSRGFKKFLKLNKKGNLNKPSEHTVFQMDVVNFEELDLMKLLSIKVYI